METQVLLMKKTNKSWFCLFTRWKVNLVTSRAACRLHYALDSIVVGLVLSGGAWGKKGFTPSRGDTLGDRWERNTWRGDVGLEWSLPQTTADKRKKWGSQSFSSEFSIRAKGAAVWEGQRRWEARLLSIRIMCLDKMHFAYVRPPPGRKLFRLRRI